jgi:hypothetical protein
LRRSIANDRPIALVSSPCPVVDPDHGRHCGVAHTVLADRQQKAPGETLSRTTAQREADVIHDALQAGGTPCPRLGHCSVEPFGEDHSRAILTATSETPDLKPDPNAAAMCWEICQTPLVLAVGTVIFETLNDQPTATGHGNGNPRANSDTCWASHVLPPQINAACTKFESSEKIDTKEIVTAGHICLPRPRRRFFLPWRAARRW